MSSTKMKQCRTCGQMIAKSAKRCPHCGAKNKKPIYKRVWFDILAIIALAIAFITIYDGIRIYDWFGTLPKASVVSQAGYEEKMSGVKFHKEYDKYPDGKSNPYYLSDISADDTVRYIQGDIKNELGFSLIYTKGGWLFTSSEVDMSKVKEGTKIHIEGYVKAPNYYFVDKIPQTYIILKSISYR